MHSGSGGTVDDALLGPLGSARLESHRIDRAITTGTPNKTGSPRAGLGPCGGFGQWNHTVAGGLNVRNDPLS